MNVKGILLFNAICLGGILYLIAHFLIRITEKRKDEENNGRGNYYGKPLRMGQRIKRK